MPENIEPNSNTVNIPEYDTSYALKIQTYFQNVCINKRLLRDLRNFELPQYVFEWLLSKYSKNGNISESDEKNLFKTIEMNYPEPEKLETFKYRMMREFKDVLILNPYSASIDTKADRFNVYCPFFSSESTNIDVIDKIIEDNKRLLYNEVWGIARFHHEAMNPRPFKMIDFQPVQIQNVSLQEFIDIRQHLTLSEWTSCLINTLGLNPETFPTVREKMYVLGGLAPYVEMNYNLIEMGPKATGKSYLHKNISTHNHVIGGGIISRAQLFYNLRDHMKGIIFSNDVVVFDDFSQIRVDKPNEVISKLKNYMADGLIDVGAFKERARGSIVIMGNIYLDLYGNPIERFHFKNLPEPMQESAFLDRLAAFIPGWKLKPIQPINLSSDYGLVRDYFSEIMHELRKRKFSAEIKQNLEFFGKNCRQRDVDNMVKTVSAYIKLLFPDGNISVDDWELLGHIAVDLRSRVIKQLAVIDPEYQNIEIQFQVIK